MCMEASFLTLSNIIKGNVVCMETPFLTYSHAARCATMPGCVCACVLRRTYLTQQWAGKSLNMEAKEMPVQCTNTQTLKFDSN